MKTKYFNGSIGFEVTDTADAAMSQKLGLALCDSQGYFFDFEVDDEDEDGNAIERDPTEEEKLNRAIEELKEGRSVYATMLPPTGYLVAPDKATMLTCDFRVGQKIYTMHDNKITEMQVKYIAIADGCRDESAIDDSLQEIADNLYYQIGFSFKSSLPTSVPYDKEKYIKSCVKKFALGSYAIVSYRYNGHTLYRHVPLGEIFASKEELVKHLMGEF